MIANNINYNNSCNNDIDNDNDKITHLFYQVIHNKFIFNKIFHFIHTIDWVEYYDLNNIYIDNRKRFKDIHSLEWMVNKKQFALLKCKLEASKSSGNYGLGSSSGSIGNGGNGGIGCSGNVGNGGCNGIDISSGGNICNSGSIGIGSIGSSDGNIGNIINDEYIIFDCSSLEWLNQLLKSDREFSIEIFKLLLSSNSIRNKDKFLNEIYQLDQELIQIAISPPYSVPVFSTMLEKSFLYSTPQQIKILLDSFYGLNNGGNASSNQFINLYKYSIIKVAFQIPDIFQRDKVVQLILCNEQYFKLPEVSRSIFENKNNNIIELDKILFQLVSIENQNQLLKLNLYKLPDKLTKYSNKINHLINSNNNKIDNSNNSNHSVVLNLIKFYLKKTSNSKIKQPLKEFNRESLLSVENFKLFLTNNQYNWQGEFIDVNGINKLLVDAKNKNRICKELNDYLLSVSKLPEFAFMKSTFECIARYELRKEVNHDLIDFSNCFETDLIISDSNYPIDQSSYQQLNIALQSFNIQEINSFKDNKILFSKFIKEIGPLNQLSNNQDFEILSTFIKDSINENYQLVYYLLDYYNSTTNYSKFKNVIDDSNIEALEAWVILFIISIKRESLNRIQLFLENNFNPIIQHSKLFIQLCGEIDADPLLSDLKDDQIPIFNFIPKTNEFKEFKSEFITQDYGNRNPNDIIEIIKSILNYSSTLSATNRDAISTLSVVINYLYKLVIQSKSCDVTIEKISDINQFINECGIVKVKESTSNSIYYLSHKSMLLIKFIAELPQIRKLRNSIQYTIVNGNIIYPYIMSDESSEGNACNFEDILMHSNSSYFDYSNYISSDHFSFEYILGNGGKKSTFETLLNELVKLFIYDEIKDGAHNNNYILYKYLMQYLLNIRRSDLFLHHLEIIIKNVPNILNDCDIKLLVVKTGDQNLISKFTQQQ